MTDPFHLAAWIAGTLLFVGALGALYRICLLYTSPSPRD